MFPKQRLATRAICERIPFELQVYMWHCIDTLDIERDYLQVFKLFSKDGKQMMVHEQEVPPCKNKKLCRSRAFVCRNNRRKAVIISS